MLLLGHIISRHGISFEMVACVCAAASSSPVWCFFAWFLSLLVAICQAEHAYRCQDLIKIGPWCRVAITSNSWAHNIAEDISHTPGPGWIVFGTERQRRRQRSKDRKQRRMSRLKRQPHRPPLPNIILSNVRSIVHKMNEMELLLVSNKSVRDCCVLLISETWLHPMIPDTAVQLAGRTLHHLDQSKDSGKSRGGGLCVYVHADWCTDSWVIHSYCSPDLESCVDRCTYPES